jgi:hypothetical protein
MITICFYIANVWGAHGVPEGPKMDADTSLPQAPCRKPTVANRKPQERYAAFRATPYARDGIDSRTRPYRRYGTIKGAITSDLGGDEHITELQRQLISKFAAMAMQLEDMEAAAVAGEEIDLDLFGRISGHCRRIAESLGLKRVPKDVTPLAEYLATINEDAE